MSETSTGAMMHAVPLLDVLLRIRQDMQQRHTAPYLYVGMVDVHWVASFINGYGSCLQVLGVREGSDEVFGEWLRGVKRAWPGEGWDTAYLAEAGGNHERALRKYLDFVAEFRALPPRALAAIPYYGLGEHPAAGEPSLPMPPDPPIDVLGLLARLSLAERALGRLDGITMHRRALQARPGAHHG